MSEWIEYNGQRPSINLMVVARFDGETREKAESMGSYEVGEINWTSAQVKEYRIIPSRAINKTDKQR